DAVGSYTIPDSAHVAYMVTTDVSGGAKIRRFPGTYYATSDFLDPTSDPVFGITLTVEALWLEDPTTQLGSWSITFTEPTGCDDDPPVDEPVDEEPVDETPVDEEPADAPVDEEITPEPLPVIVPADPPVVEVSSQVVTADDTQPELAFTGDDTARNVAVGAGLLLVGASALWVGRRRGEVR